MQTKDIVNRNMISARCTKAHEFYLFGTMIFERLCGFSIHASLEIHQPFVIGGVEALTDLLFLLDNPENF